MLPVDDAMQRVKAMQMPELYADVLDLYKRVFSNSDNVGLVRAPGRVNLIGEHTDYNGLPVMPMAIDREIVIAYSPIEVPEIEIINIDQKFPARRFEMSNNIVPGQAGDWANYVKAAAQALWEWATVNAPDALPLKGFRGCVGGSIPSGSGLSSSSALVVAAACVLVDVNNLKIPRPVLADLLARGERYVGTEGGGMDQAVSLMGDDGKAVKIDFFPLRTRAVQLPPEYSIIVANSMVSAKKSEGARNAYNKRVAECRLGLEMLKHMAASEYPDVKNATLLQHFANSVPEWRKFVSEMPEGPMTVHQIASYIQAGDDKLYDKCLRMRDGNIMRFEDDLFQPKKRVRHVLSEGERVRQAAQAMEQGDAVEFGRLMDESHISCAYDYEISCEELDKLVFLMKECGALGARLTGAGFGGCAVAFVSDESKEDLIDVIWEEFYNNYLPAKGIKTPLSREEVLFACKAKSGAGPVDFGKG